MKPPTRRARRMQRSYNLRKASPLNLVSLMDIFTILVFFLLVNASSAPQLPNQKDLKLPTSIAQKTPKEALILVVTPQAILVQGREIIKISAVATQTADVIAALLKELEYQSSNRTLKLANATAKTQGRSITIMGDQNVSYGLLRKILATCQQASYTDIAFAAQQKPKTEL